MNKYILLPALALTLTLASCDMDKNPYNAIPEDEALMTPTDFTNMSVPLYTGMRSFVGSSYFCTGPDEQSDDFNATVGTGLSDLHRWDFNTSLSSGDALYSNSQTMIARANFIIDGYNKCDMSNKNLFTDQAMVTVKNVKGEAFFVRAYFLFNLAQYFCADYDNRNADEKNSGVSYRLDYYPSSNSATYPARKTLRETYKQITDDLDSALLYVNVAGEQSNYYISVDAVKAMQARVALAMDDYATAAEKATEVIGTTIYTLAGSVDRLTQMWAGNFDTETIFKLAASATSQLSSQTGLQYLPYTSGGAPGYVPTQTVLDLYSDDDYRKSVYFLPLTFQTSTGVVGNVLAFNKYPEKAYPYEATNGYDYARFTIEPKVIRISEMYLIAAEAYAQLAKTDGSYLTKAAQYLNDFKAKRIAGYQAQSFSSPDRIMSEIRDERHREFLGEGTRLLDLKRWDMGVTRGTPQQEEICAMPGADYSTNLSKPAGDYRFVWPIPKHEMDTNPQIVQNPGY